MPDPKDNLTSLTSSKDQLAQVSQTAEGVKSGALPAADAFKIPDQVAAAQEKLGGLEGGAHIDKAKDAMDNAAKAAGGLQDELAKKLPPPVSSGKDALTGLGQEVKASGDPLKGIAASLPQAKLPIGDAAGKVGDLQKKAPSAKTLQKSIPDIQSKLAPMQEQIPKVASQLDPPKKTIEDLNGKLKDVLGVVKPLMDKPPLSQSLAKAGTGDLIKKHLADAEGKLPLVPPLIDQAKAKLTAAIAPLLEASKKLAELQAAAVAAIPPLPNPSLDSFQQQINEAAAAVTQAADPVNAAATNIPAAQQQVTQAQTLVAGASDQMKPPELKQTMNQVGQLIGDAQKQVAAPAAGMPNSAEAAAPIQSALTAITDAGAVTLPLAAAAAPAGQEVKAAELFTHAQDALKPAPDQMAAAAPAVQQLAEKLPELSGPLAQALQTMNDALTPQQQDLAELERLLLQAQDQMTAQTKQVDDSSKQIDESRKKVDSAAEISDAGQLKTMLDDITAGLPQLDDKPISDLEKKLPDLEALLDRIEKSGGGAA